MKRILAALSSGVVLAVIYNVIGSFLDVYLGHLFHQAEHPIVVLVFTFSIMAVFFLAFQLKSPASFFSLFKKAPKQILWVNVTTAMAWVGSFLSLKYLEPAVFTAVCFGLGPVINVAFWKVLRPERPPYRGEVIAGLGLFLSLVALTTLSFSGYSGLGNLPTLHVVLGLAYALLAALGVVLATVAMKGLGERGVDSKTMMALRFFLLIGLGLTLWPAGPITPSPFIKVFLPTMVAFTFLALIVPLYLAQLAIQRTEPITFSILACLTPAFTFILQLFDSRLTPSLMTLLGVLLCVGFAVQGVLAGSNKDEKIRVRRTVRAKLASG